MSGLSWAGFLAAAAAVLALVARQYWRREPSTPARAVLGALRGAALLLLLLLLFDPPLPAAGGPGARAGVLVDGSLSMLGAASAGSRWDGAVARARAAGGTAIVFGEGADVVPADSLAGLAPTRIRSNVLDAVRTAAEAGLSRLEVITDGELEDAREAASAARELGLDLTWRVVRGPDAPNAALVEFDAPRWAAPGDTMELEAAVLVAGGASPDTLRVEVRAGERVLGEASVPAPRAGALARTVVRVVAPAASGSLLRLDARVTPGGAHAADDVRTAYARLSEEGGGVVVVALEPGWDTRFLLPALEAATALPTAGYLAVGEAGFARAGDGAGRVAPAAVAGAARDAELLVVLGAGPRAPAWARELIARGPPLVLLPSAEGAPAELPVSGAAAPGGDWYLAEQPPASPLAIPLEALVVDSLPPLSALRPVAGDAPPHVVALGARRARRGPVAPALILGEGPRGRWAAVLGDGLWRWSLRGGRARAGYRQTWSAVVGWLLASEPTFADRPIRPRERVIPRGGAMEWLVSGGADSLTVEFTRADAPDSTLSRGARVVDGAAEIGPLPPGHYAYRASAGGGPGATAASGELTVESFTREFVRGPAELENVRAGGGGALAAGSRPLHATPLVYVLLLALLAAEWVLRRREGLR